MTDALSGFHPAIQTWFQRRFAAPSPPQAKGWPAIRDGRDTLIAAPTGSGKTLAAFLWCLDSLIRQGLDGDLKDETQVLYLSPLKALSNDVQKNLAQPLEEIGSVLEEMELPVPEVRVLVRTGDTPSSQRQAMVRKPPHILVTTPESFYILLTSVRGRDMLRTVRTVIVDEIHAVAGTKRGTHLALSLERLERLAMEVGARPTRIGLSATQKPIEEVARLLVGSDTPMPVIVDEGYKREMRLEVELPSNPLEAVCSLETWEQVYNRLADLVTDERTTLIFVNTRRLAERLTFHLSKRLGEDHVTSHHGSLSREHRLKAEQKLKAGKLKALVATASLELGIDIGTVDLVCQIGSSRSISTLLQRVGRSGHTLGGTPRGKVFPLTRDELVECAAIFHEVKRGNLDRIEIPEGGLDILAQQMVAMTASDDWDEDELYLLCRRAYPYRDLAREDFDAVAELLSEGFSNRTGRAGAYLHHDAVNRRFTARKGARLAAVTNGGAIPDNADYTVALEPENTFVGTVNEDWAIESLPGDIFQLGATSWRIIRVEPGIVRVEDAHGQPPTMPFWLGEAPGRTDEVSGAVSLLRRTVGELLPDTDAAVLWLIEQTGISEAAAQQIVEYMASGKRVLGAVPTQDTIVLERFFDESGGMQLVLHAPFGSRVNRAWGLALRKRFCRTFNTELQAAANEDAIVLSLGPQHSFPLEEVFSYLHPNSVQEVLVQAVLASPMFQTRWRWNVTRALSVLRFQGGKKVAMPLQRMRSDDMLGAAFPDLVACQENVVGPLELPDHPLVQQTVKDCLYEGMDADGLLRVVTAIVERRVELLARDTTEASVFAHEILTARPYAFLDDAPLEERRTQAVYMRRAGDAAAAGELGQLDPEAIRRVREQAWPEVESADELHDALLTLNYLTEGEGQRMGALPEPHPEALEGLEGRGDAWFRELIAAGRATVLQPGLWVATERVPLLKAAFPASVFEPPVRIPERFATEVWEPETALREVLRGRLEALGPVTAQQLGAPLALEARSVLPALTALEAEGAVFRGQFSPRGALPEALEGRGAIPFEGLKEQPEWCDRRLLARIHRYTLDHLRREIEPVSAADFIRFLISWQHVQPEHRLEGTTGLIGALECLQGFEAPVTAWEEQVLPARLNRYSPAWLEQVCLSGEVLWARLYPPNDPETRRAGIGRMTPIALLFREDLDYFQDPEGAPRSALSGAAQEILERLAQRGACFFQDLVSSTRRLPSEVEEGLRELAAAGLITCDGFAGLLSLVSKARRDAFIQYHRERRTGDRWARPRPGAPGPGGRWSTLWTSTDLPEPDQRLEFQARQLLRRWGVVFPRLLVREPAPPPWRDLVRVYRRLEARGEVRGGRFVAGFSGEQYALPDAVQQLRAIRRARLGPATVTVSGADPLNLVGILTPGPRVPATPGNRVVYRGGVPVSIDLNGRETSLELPLQGQVS